VFSNEKFSDDDSDIIRPKTINGKTSNPFLEDESDEDFIGGITRKKNKVINMTEYDFHFYF